MWIVPPSGVLEFHAFTVSMERQVNCVLREGFASGKNAIVGVNPLTNVVTTVIRSSRVPVRLLPF
jgi:hypothetical protein